MRIIIPTRGRIYEQTTLQSLPPELHKRTTLVCPKREVSVLHRLYADVEIVVQPDHIRGIAQVREFIVQTRYEAGHDKIIMCDDDLVFATRIAPGDWHLREIRGEELIPEFQRIEDMLGPECPHVGFGQRQNNNNEDGGWKSPGKMCFTLAYFLPIVANEARWDLVELREDYSVSLQLLLKGYPNAIWTRTVTDQITNAPGGCSTYRTPEINDVEAERLQRQFPDYVSVRCKTYGNGSRKEVTVNGRKALEDGLRHRWKR